MSGFAPKITSGEMAEWSIAAVLKTVEANYLQGFESLSLRIFLPLSKGKITSDGPVAQLDRATAF